MASYNKMLFALVVVLCFFTSSMAFTVRTTRIARNVARIKMEYIPDGISKEKVRAAEHRGEAFSYVTNISVSQLTDTLNYPVGGY